MQEQFGVPGFTEGWIQEWLSQIKSLGFRISCAAGKPNATATVRSLYRQLLELAGKSIERLSTQLRTLQPLWAQQRYPPSVQSQFDKAVGTVFDCLGQAVCICQYAERRIEEGVNLPASEKILSVSDRTAAFIKKGGREPVIGYKPQVLRTATGFITVAELCEGNPNDSTRFVPVVQTHIALTGVTPTVASSDDGYSTAEVRDTLLGMQVEIVSMSGSKGKRLTGEEEWEGPAYQTARRQRSAVESSIWVLRCKFSLYRFSRCGIDAVRAELQERVLVYNLWRAALLRRRRAEEPAADQAA
jgi:hypothetical protein